MPSKRKRIFILSGILLFAAVFRLLMLDHPFTRTAEGCGSFFGQLARNYFRYDFSVTHGVPVMSLGQNAPPVFYANHPPTTALMIAFVHWITGYRGQFDTLPGDWQLRTPTMLFTLACIAAIYFLVKERAGLIAAALFAAIPMTLVFGGQPDVINTQLIFFVLLTIKAYERFHDKIGWRNFLIFCVAFLGAGIMDWPAYYLVPIFCVHFVITKNWRRWPWMVLFGFFSVAIFSLLYAQLAIAQHDWHWMLAQVSRRSISSEGDSFNPFTFSQWLHRAIWEFAIGQHTIFVVLLGLLWLPLAVSRRMSNRADRFTALLLAWALLHVLAGRQGVFQHQWWWWPLTPGIVIAAALVLDRFVPCRPQMNVCLMIVIAIFAIFNIFNATDTLIHEPAMIHNSFDYSAAEFGQAIRQFTPPDSAIMVAENDDDLAFWYYADRAVKRKVWDIAAINRRLSDNREDLPFNIHGPFTGPAVTFIAPKAWLPKIGPTINYLDAHYPKKETAKFVIYDLSH